MSSSFITLGHVNVYVTHGGVWRRPRWICLRRGNSSSGPTQTLCNVSSHIGRSGQNGLVMLSASYSGSADGRISAN
jgi:hypothetical protein